MVICRNSPPCVANFSFRLFPFSFLLSTLPFNFPHLSSLLLLPPNPIKVSWKCCKLPSGPGGVLAVKRILCVLKLKQHISPYKTCTHAHRSTRKHLFTEKNSKAWRQTSKLMPQFQYSVKLIFVVKIILPGFWFWTPTSSAYATDNRYWSNWMTNNRPNNKVHRVSKVRKIVVARTSSNVHQLW